MASLFFRFFLPEIPGDGAVKDSFLYKGVKSYTSKNKKRQFLISVFTMELQC